MQKPNRIAPALLAAALLLLLLNSPPLGNGSKQLVEVFYFAEFGTGQPLLYEVEVVVLHSVDWGSPRKARPGEAVVFIAGDVRRVGQDGSVRLKVPRGNHTLSVYWADGRLAPLRTKVSVDKDLRVTVTFTEVRLKPAALSMSPDVTKGVTSLTVAFDLFRFEDVYFAPPIVRYFTSTGELRAVPPVVRPEMVSALPYSVRPSSLFAGQVDETALEEGAAPLQASISVELPGIAATVLSDSYIPMLVIDYSVQEVERD
ncbi:MAG: hypothetical protein NZ733_02185 [Aigarchaeota archaeon]|nr:hypothetical protein [Aigarchaeota archaeon]MDW8043395.1 hypothetical protein [Nitrososphaerota archaeon]